MKPPTDVTGFVAVMEQHVVAEQVGVDHAARQRVMPVLRLEADLRAQQLGVLARQERIDLRRAGGPPLRTAQILQDATVGLPREVHLGQHLAHPRTVLGGGIQDRRTLQEGDDGGGLAVQLAEEPVAQVGDRLGAGNAVGGQVRHQVQVERQLPA